MAVLVFQVYLYTVLVIEKKKIITKSPLKSQNLQKEFLGRGQCNAFGASTRLDLIDWLAGESRAPPAVLAKRSGVTADESQEKPKGRPSPPVSRVKPIVRTTTAHDAAVTTTAPQQRHADGVDTSAQLNTRASPRAPARAVWDLATSLLSCET